jgi:hypothetical protein
MVDDYNVAGLQWEVRSVARFNRRKADGDRASLIT